MLKIEATRGEKRFSMWKDGLIFTAGFMALTSAFAMLASAPQDEVQIYLLLVLLPLGLVCSVTYGIKLWRDLCCGRAHTRVLVTDRTLAIAPRGVRAQFIKRRDIIGASYSGRTLVAASGVRHDIGRLWGLHSDQRTRKRVLVPLYDLWWPDCSLARVERHFRNNAPGFYTTVFGVVIVIFAPFGSTYVERFAGPLWSIAFLATIPVALFIGSRLVARKTKRLHFRFDGPEEPDDGKASGERKPSMRE